MLTATSRCHAFSLYRAIDLARCTIGFVRLVLYDAQHSVTCTSYPWLSAGTPPGSEECATCSESLCRFSTVEPALLFCRFESLWVVSAGVHRIGPVGLHTKRYSTHVLAAP